jgi:hypothetical protein
MQPPVPVSALGRAPPSTSANIRCLARGSSQHRLCRYAASVAQAVTANLDSLTSKNNTWPPTMRHRRLLRWEIEGMVSSPITPLHSQTHPTASVGFSLSAVVVGNALDHTRARDCIVYDCKPYVLISIDAVNQSQNSSHQATILRRGTNQGSRTVSSCRMVPEGSAFSAHLRFRKEHKPNTNHDPAAQGTVMRRRGLY